VIVVHEQFGCTIQVRRKITGADVGMYRAVGRSMAASQESRRQVVCVVMPQQQATSFHLSLEVWSLIWQRAATK